MYILKPIVFALTIIAFGGLGLYGASAVDQWERANGYPYGKACNLPFNSCN